MNFDETEKPPEYVPLWKQVKESFQLRPENEDYRFESLLGPSERKQPTIPMSPKFQTQERGEFKQRFLSMLEPDSAEKVDKTLFKARELNRKILTSVGKLPDVEIKQLTTFEEF